MRHCFEKSLVIMPPPSDMEFAIQSAPMWLLIRPAPTTTFMLCHLLYDVPNPPAAACDVPGSRAGWPAAPHNQHHCPHPIVQHKVASCAPLVLWTEVGLAAAWSMQTAPAPAVIEGAAATVLRTGLLPAAGWLQVLLCNVSCAGKTTPGMPSVCWLDFLCGPSTQH